MTSFKWRATINWGAYSTQAHGTYYGPTEEEPMTRPAEWSYRLHEDTWNANYGGRELKITRDHMQWVGSIDDKFEGRFTNQADARQYLVTRCELRSINVSVVALQGTLSANRGIIR